MLPGSVLYYYGIYNDYTTTFYVTNDNAVTTTYFVWYALAVFIIVFALLSKHKYYLRPKITLSKHDIRTLTLLLGISILCLFIVVSIFYSFGMRNALIGSVITHENIVEIRLANRYSGIPTVIISYFIFLLHFSAILFGASIRSLSKVKKFFYFFALLFFMSWLGDKALYLYIFVEIFISHIYFISISTINEHKASRTLSKSSIKLIIISIFSIVAFLIVAQLQIGFTNTHQLVGYLMGRGVLGQIAGVYEEFGLGLHDIGYALTNLPFLSFLFNHDYFNKDLMMATWGVGLASSEDTGVMNSMFIGEAFAIGGYGLVLMSPIIVAVSLFWSHSLLYWIMRKFININRNLMKSITVFIVASTFSLAGDFGPYMFMKLAIMEILFLISILIIYKMMVIRTNDRCAKLLDN